MDLSVCALGGMPKIIKEDLVLCQKKELMEL